MNFIHDLKYFLINKTKDILIYYYLKVVYSLYGTPSPPVLILPWALASRSPLALGLGPAGCFRNWGTPRETQFYQGVTIVGVFVSLLQFFV